MASVPPASVNDNVEGAELSMPDLLAEIADALNEPEPGAATSNVISPDFEALRKLRAELVAIRDSLRVAMPAATAAVQ